jgi:hypothetical protein
MVETGPQIENGRKDEMMAHGFCTFPTGWHQIKTKLSEYF